MASRSGADHTRTPKAAGRKPGRDRTNADGGGSLARRRIGSSGAVCPCVQTVTAEVGKSGFGLQEARPLLSGMRPRGQRLAGREHLARTLTGEHELGTAKGSIEAIEGAYLRERRSSRREPVRQPANRRSSARRGARTESDGRRLGSRRSAARHGVDESGGLGAPGASARSAEKPGRAGGERDRDVRDEDRHAARNRRGCG